MTAAAAGWAAATASVRGASHDRDGKPNQDAVRVVQVSGKTPGLVAAVCDGHGGDRYVRSDIGSRLGVEVACEVSQRALADLGSSANASTVEARLAGVVAESIVERWRERVLDDVHRRAFTDEERARAGVPLDGDPHIAYGATLLLAIFAPSWVGLLQIGDGDVTVVRQTLAESPVPGDDRLVGGETTSLCLPTAVADARCCVLVEPLPETIILTSDGYANSFASPTWRTDAGIDLRDHVRRIGLDAVEARLPSWLADSATAGGDDVSMALIQRVDGVASPLPAIGKTRTATGGVSGKRLQRRGLLPIALTVAALAGAAAGWVLARTSESEAVSTTTAATLVTSAPSTSTPPVQTLVPPPTTSTTSTTPSTTTTTSDGTSGGDLAQATAAPPTQLVLLSGTGGNGLLIRFDPSQANANDPQFMGWVTSADDNSPPAEGLTLDATGLTFANGDVREAIAATYQGGFIWAVGKDCKTLTSYDLTGAQTGRATISGSRVDPAAAANGESKCAAVAGT